MTRRFILAGLLLAVLSGASWGCDDAAPPPSKEAAAQKAVADSQQADPEKDSPPPSVPQDGKSVADRVTEASTAARAKIALLETPSLKGLSFEPSVAGDHLTLRGDVATRAQRKKAAQVAEDVDGVDEVSNRLLVAGREVKPPPKESPPEQIAEAQSSAKPPSESTAPEPDEHTVASEASNSRKESSQDQEATVQKPSAQKSSSSRKNKKKKQAASKEYYTVKSGDSLWNIARDHGTSVSKIKQLNDLRSNSLHPGDKLRVQ